MYDLMIIGSGPAGISAALTAKARNLNFIWFGSRALSTKIEKAEKIMNYPGTSCCYRKRNAVCILKAD